MKVEEMLAKHKEHRLSPDEKATIRASLSEFADEHPVEEVGWLDLLSSPKYAFAASLIVLCLVFGTAWASENSLPGDTLYPVKIGVNEHVLSWAAVGQKKQGYWETQRAARRLEEVEFLAAQNLLTVESATLLYKDFTRSEDSIKKIIANFSENGDFGTAVSVNHIFSANLTAHRTLVDELSNTVGQSSLQNLRASLFDKEQFYADNLIHLWSEITTAEDFDRKAHLNLAQKRAEEAIQKAEQVITKYSETPVTSSQQIILQARDFKTSADSFHDYEIADTAFEQYETAANLALQAQIIARQERNLNRFLEQSEEGEVRGQGIENRSENEENNKGNSDKENPR